MLSADIASDAILFFGLYTAALIAAVSLGVTLGTIRITGCWYRLFRGPSRRQRREGEPS